VGEGSREAIRFGRMEQQFALRMEQQLQLLVQQQ
jgi:hypothetical protein